MTWNLRRLRIGSSVVAGSLLLLLGGGFLFQYLATERERRAFPPVGRLVDAGGYRLHLYCLGKGSPAVIFESGFGMSLNAWALVQPAVATLTRACSYDRPGYGWSDKPSDPRTGIRAAEDLHRALANAGIPEPYLLVGHSMGGGQARLFASRYPTEVAGLVIVASGHEDWRTRNPFAPPEDESMDHLFQAIAWLSPTGLPRLFGMLFQPSFAADYVADLRTWLPERAYKSEITFLAQSKHAQAMADEIRAMRAIESELRRARDFGDIPLIVLSEKWPLPERAETRDIEAARIEDELQEEMSRFSRRGKHVRIDSGHLIPLEKPAAVIDAVRMVLGTPKE
jgi:pimeloyl-ACP methyl ester carboxylesterase